jgi:hypothetical protein
MAGLLPEIAAGCEERADSTELRAYVLEREPGTVGIFSFSRDGRAVADILTRRSRDGFAWLSYAAEGALVVLQAERSGTLGDLVAYYASLDEPSLDLVAQYEIYRMRDCALDEERYPGMLTSLLHAQMVERVGSSLPESELYLGALLAVDPTDLFAGGGRSSRATKVGRLLSDVGRLAPYLQHDLDIRTE